MNEQPADVTEPREAACLALIVGAIIGVIAMACVGCAAVAPLALPALYDVRSDALAVRSALSELIDWLSWAIVQCGGDPAAGWLVPLGGAPQ